MPSIRSDYEVIQPKDLASTLHAIMQDNLETNEGVAVENLKEAGDAAVNFLRANSPKLEGHYAEGWTAYFSDNFKRGNAAQVVVATKIKPSLTHLLEFGHVLVYFGHKTGRRVRAIPHIAPAYKVGAAVLERAKVDNP